MASEQESHDLALRVVVWPALLATNISHFRFQQRNPVKRTRVAITPLQKRVAKQALLQQSGRRPVSDEGVLDVVVRVAAWRGPASLHAQHQVSRYLWDGTAESFFAPAKRFPIAGRRDADSQ